MVDGGDKKNITQLVPYFEWNQILYRTLYVWLDQQSGGRHIFSLAKLAARLRIGWERRETFVFFFWRPDFVIFLGILQRYGYVYATYKFTTPWLHLIYPKVRMHREVLAVWLKPADQLGGVPVFKFYNVTGLQYTLSATQAAVLLKTTQHLYIFQSAQGMCTQREILKQQIGGVLICTVN